MKKPHVVIVGGGITGLSAAYRLQTHAAPVAVTLLESTGRLGGRIHTEEHDGFTLELGPDIFLARKPRGIGLCKELGVPTEKTSPAHRGSYLEQRGTLYRLPEGMSGLVPARWGPILKTPILSPKDKLRFAIEALIPPRRQTTDESIAAFFTRRIGKSAYLRLVEPLLGGIYGGDGAKLSLQATFPNLQALEKLHGSLLRGIRRENKKKARSSGFLSPKEGMQTLVNCLATRLQIVRVERHAAVTALLREGSAYTLHVKGQVPLQASKVLLATPAPVTAKLLAPLDAGLADEIGGIPHGSVITLSMAFCAKNIPRPLDAYGYIVPRREQKSLVACTWTSSKLPGRAPKGMALLRLFLGRGHTDSVFHSSDEDLVTHARRELHDTLGITAPPLFYRVHRCRKALPQYLVGHHERLTRIERRLNALPGLYLAGASYRGIGIPDCIQDGEHAAEAILASLFPNTT